MEKATRNSFPMNPMSDDNFIVEVHWKFSAEAYHKIEIGRIPVEYPGDNYFIFMEDNILYTGYTMSGTCISMVFFNQLGDYYEVRKIRLATNPNFSREEQIVKGLGTISVNLHDSLQVKFQKFDTIIIDYYNNFFKRAVFKAIDDDGLSWPDKIYSDKVYRMKYYKYVMRGSRDLRFLIRMDENERLYLDYYFITDDFASHKRIDQDGKITELENFEVQGILKSKGLE